MNHYECLGVSPTADPAVIKAAYRARVTAAHPDRAAGARDERLRTAETAALNAAYAVLSDQLRRADYDRELGTQSGPKQQARPSTQRTASPSPRSEPETPAPKRWRRPDPASLGRWFLADPGGQWAAIALLGCLSLLPIPFGGGLFTSLNFFCSSALPLIVAQWAVSRRVSGSPAGMLAFGLFGLLRALSPIKLR